jgi:hypothetical protein
MTTTRTTLDRMANWTTLEDGGSNRWLYARKVAPMTWVFLRIDDMVDACGRDANYWFHCDVATVDLDAAVTSGALADALRSCDAESWLSDLPLDAQNLAMAQCCFDYGASSPLWQDGSPEIDKDADDDWRWNAPEESDPEFADLLDAGRDWAEANLLDADNRERLLDTTIVNKIGQTAREFAGGTAGLWDALRRIAADPNASTEQKLVLRMYQGAGQTLGAGPVPADITGKPRS